MKKICEQCSNEYEARLSKRKYCGQTCFRMSQIVNDRACLCCDAAFTPSYPKQLYCSRSCSATVNNRKHPKRIRTKVCDVDECDTLILYGAKYCERHKVYRSKASTVTKAKMHKHAREIYIEDWLSGHESGSYANGQMSKRVRGYLLEEAGHKCTKCGWCEHNPVLGRPILSIDHIDGNWRNNARENLVVLCYNCHTLTPTFNALNVGNGRGVRGSGARTQLGDRT